MFLSRLNEISGGRGNMCLVFFGIIEGNFEVFRHAIFDCNVLRVVGEGEWKSVGFFAH